MVQAGHGEVLIYSLIHKVFWICFLNQTKNENNSKSRLHNASLYFDLWSIIHFVLYFPLKLDTKIIAQIFFCRNFIRSRTFAQFQNQFFSPTSRSNHNFFNFFHQGDATLWNFGVTKTPLKIVDTTKKQKCDWSKGRHNLWFWESYGKRP